jgi:hypothetical protein
VKPGAAGEVDVVAVEDVEGIFEVIGVVEEHALNAQSADPFASVLDARFGFVVCGQPDEYAGIVDPIERVGLDATESFPLRRILEVGVGFDAGIAQIGHGRRLSI